jgi:hypothetical protein
MQHDSLCRIWDPQLHGRLVFWMGCGSSFSTRMTSKEFFCAIFRIWNHFASAWNLLTFLMYIKFFPMPQRDSNSLLLTPVSVCCTSRPHRQGPYSEKTCSNLQQRFVCSIAKCYFFSWILSSLINISDNTIIGIAIWNWNLRPILLKSSYKKYLNIQLFSLRVTAMGLRSQRPLHDARRCRSSG